MQIVIDITGADDDNEGDRNRSPITMNSSVATMSTSTISTKLSQRSTKQASAHSLDSKRTKLDYAGRYNTAFKTAANLVAAKSGESVTEICKRLNIKYILDGPKTLARSTVYQAAKDECRSYTASAATAASY
jgi:hypothetical protein